MNGNLIELRHVSKTFFGIKALDDVTLDIQQGHILGMIGQNGAGKSTLMNILGGVISPDPGGSITLMDVPYHPRNPADATQSGIAFIHQELNLFTNLNIAENIFIDNFPKRRWGYFSLVDRAMMHQKTRDLLTSIELDLSPTTQIDELSPGERQLVEIAKALHIDANLIIFDEPTTSLTARETEQLFKIIARLRESGKTMIYISHILGDVLSIADDIAVLRDGQLMACSPKDDFTISRMISMMIGRDLDQLFPERSNKPIPETVLEVKHLSQRGIVKDINLQLNQGEILGIFGLMGSGRTELARMMFGLDEYESGKIIMNGKQVSRNTPTSRIRQRMAFVTENRREEGLMMEATIAQNIHLASLTQWTRTPAGFIDQQGLTESTHRVSDMLHIKATNIETQKAKSLSGGNQQKVVLAKWLLSNPMIFILDEPTRGIDVGAKFEIYSIINTLAAQGGSIIFISSELDELIGMCDRILVMGRGELCGEFTSPDYNKEAILRAAFREGSLS